MGIVRLAKSLKLLNSLVEHGSRENDIKSKISGNRVYMDFVSIVYRIQESVASELNYILFSYLLIQEDLLDSSEIPILRDLSNKYVNIISEPIKIIIHNLYMEYEDADLSTYILIKSDLYTKLKSKITDSYIESYKNDVRSSNNLNIYIYQDVFNFIVDMLTNKITGVEYILIAFDGIPSFGKVQEQRQRRYMRLAYNEFKKTILSRKNKSKSLDSLAYDKNDKKNKKKSIKTKLFELRKIYDADYFTVDIRSAIDYVYNSYHSGNLQEDIRKGIMEFRQKNQKEEKEEKEVILEIEVIDRPYGEGEKIIMDRLIRDVGVYKNKKTYVFYSPDGDSVLLCLYAYIKTKPRSLTVVKMYQLNPSTRINQQSQYIDIKRLYEQIVKTVNKFSSIEFKEETDMDSICRDYIFMLNLYGNDFIHQLPSMEISTTILDLFYIYSLFIKEKTNRYITRVVSDKVHIDIDVMIRFFQYLSEYEEYLMLDSYLINVDRRNRLYRLFGDIFPHRYLIRYRELVSKLKKELHENISKLSNVNEIKQNLSDFLNVLSETVTVTGKKFSDIFKKLEFKNGFNDYALKIQSDPDYLLTEQPKFIYTIKIRGNRDSKMMKNNIKLVEKSLYQTGESVDLSEIESSNNRDIREFSFDYGNIRDLLPHDQMPITSNDIDLFLLEWRSGDWKTVLNSKSHEMGYDSRNRSIRSIESEMKRYQKQMLGISDKNLDKMIGNYMRTMSWMVDYYMNSDIEVDQELISIWSYNYDRSPMITHISEYLTNVDRKGLKNMIKKVYDKSLVHTSRYLQNDRHKFYIYPQPKNIIDRLDSQYIKVFPDINAEVHKSIKVLESIRKNKKSDKVKTNDTNKEKNNKQKFFDCRECPYFSKCIFDAASLTFKELVSMPIPGMKNNYPIVQDGKGRKTKYNLEKKYKYRNITIKKKIKLPINSINQ
jgi:hypothetical protein